MLSNDFFVLLDPSRCFVTLVSPALQRWLWDGSLWGLAQLCVRIISELQVCFRFFPFTIFIRNTVSSWDSARCRPGGGKPGSQWKLPHLSQELCFSKTQTQPRNCYINIGESLDARKFGFVIEVSTKQQPKHSSLNKSVLERLYGMSSCDPKYSFKICSSTWIFSPYKVNGPHGQPSVAFEQPP